MKRKVLFVIITTLNVVAASAATFYTAGNTYEDGSWRQYVVMTESVDPVPPDPDGLPCRGRIAYGPEWCTTAANCLARAAALPSVPQCPKTPDYPVYP